MSEVGHFMEDSEEKSVKKLYLSRDLKDERSEACLYLREHSKPDC